MAKPQNLIRAPKGMNDVLPNAGDAFLSCGVWDRIFSIASRVLAGYGYQQVRLPVVEDTALFARGIGEATDIVQKEMFTFTRSEQSLTLRPEGTAGAVRAYIEHDFGNNNPVQRWWYAGPMFRAERPQAGRYRQFYQIGAELLGTDSPVADAEMVIMLWRLCRELGLDVGSGVRVRMNSLGDGPSRLAYRQTLSAFLLSRASGLCQSCQARLATNPLRALDCKREECRGVVADAPNIADSLSQASAEHFATVERLITEAGVAYVRDPRLVRGLDYYTGTLFEFTTNALGAQDAILGGGRYDELCTELGGPATPAIGFAAGVERLALLLSKDAQGSLEVGVDLYLIPMAGTEGKALKLADDLRTADKAARVDVDVSGKKLKQQMRRADKSGARFVLVLGETEVQTGRGKLKCMKDGQETEVDLRADRLVAAFGRSGACAEVT
jgi:histidyl-tRNA synthetase